jgi:hypothetical protein
MEAKELTRHADIRQTAKYTHIGREDRAEALANLQDHLISTFFRGGRKLGRDPFWSHLRFWLSRV